MKIPKKIKPIFPIDWTEGDDMNTVIVDKLNEITKTLNDLLEFHYQWHSPENHKGCGTGCKHPSHHYQVGGSGSVMNYQCNCACHQNNGDYCSNCQYNHISVQALVNGGGGC